MKNESFELDKKVRISVSGEEGIIIGRAEYTETVDHYLIRYKSADGRALENWWSVKAIEACE